MIQRVGRINRIGKKVFENLYIFNFFPTVKGSSIVNNRETAQTKMFAIHRILGEDAQIFSLEEEPTASALYDKRRSSRSSVRSIRRVKRFRLSFGSIRLTTRRKADLGEFDESLKQYKPKGLAIEWDRFA